MEEKNSYKEKISSTESAGMEKILENSSVQARWPSSNVLAITHMLRLNLQQRKRHILHIDADAFFASVEQILDPRLKGKPVLVGGPSGRHGIVSAASYEARKFGVHSGMAMYMARKKCPHGIVVAGHFDEYRKFSRKMYRVFAKYTPDVEMTSIDEAYLDITGCSKAAGLREGDEGAEVLARQILLEIYESSGLSVSCGMASNKTVAKVSSSRNKPHKFTRVAYGSEAKFLAELPVRAMPGVGPRTTIVLERGGVEKLGQLAEMDLYEVMRRFGMQAIGLWKRARGVDNRPVLSGRELPKSISKEHTFYQKVFTEEAVMAEIKRLSVRVFAKLRHYGMKASTVFVKIRYWKKDDEVREGSRKKFVQQEAQRHLEVPSCCDSKLLAVAKKLVRENLELSELGEGQIEPVRLVGIGVSGLKQVYNLSLFEWDEEEDGLFYAIDALKKAHGEDALKYGV